MNLAMEATDTQPGGPATTGNATTDSAGAPWWPHRSSIGATCVANILRSAGDQYLFVFRAEQIMHSDQRDHLGVVTALNSAANSSNLSAPVPCRRGWDQLPDPTIASQYDEAVVLHEAIEALFWATPLRGHGLRGSRAAALPGHYSSAALDLVSFEVELRIELEIVAHRPVHFVDIEGGHAIGLVVGDHEAETVALSFMVGSPLSEQFPNTYRDHINERATQIVRDLLRMAAGAVDDWGQAEPAIDNDDPS